MHVTDSAADGDIVESQLVSDTELDLYDSDVQDSCMYRNSPKQTYLADSLSPNYYSTAETLPTYSPVTG